MAHAFACLNALGAPLARPGRPVAQRRRLAATGVSQSHGVYLSPRPARSCMRCRASQEEQEKADKVAGTERRPTPPTETETPAKLDIPGGLQKGQTTAIVTGIVSIAFGVAYLALVQLMDSRGDQLLPPPPEAFGL